MRSQIGPKWANMGQNVLNDVVPDSLARVHQVHLQNAQVAALEVLHRWHVNRRSVARGFGARNDGVFTGELLVGRQLIDEFVDGLQVDQVFRRLYQSVSVQNGLEWAKMHQNHSFWGHSPPFSLVEANGGQWRPEGGRRGTYSEALLVHDPAAAALHGLGDIVSRLSAGNFLDHASENGALLLSIEDWKGAAVAVERMRLIELP